MPLVFVHGVATRMGPAYTRDQRRREALLRAMLLPKLVAEPSQVQIFEPYWGGDGARFLWDHGCLPRSDVERFGPGHNEEDILLAESCLNGEVVFNPLATIAQEHLSGAIDLLWTLASNGQADEDLSDLAEFTARASEYAEANERPTWLSQGIDDDGVLTRLMAAAKPTDGPPTEQYGGKTVAAQLREAALRLAAAPARAVSVPLVEAARSVLHRTAATFLGDVLVYLRQREEAGPDGAIAKAVAGSIDSALAARCPEDPQVIILTHSMGGNIVYDLLSNLRQDLSCDVLVTAGSQPGLFAELGLFPSVNPPIDIARDRVTQLKYVGRWLNVVDVADVLAFAAEPIFAGVQDFRYSTGRGPLRAHSTYYARPSFYLQLARRLIE